MNSNDIFPSRYLKSSDIGENKVKVTISNVIMESVGQEEEKEMKAVCYFSGKEKGLILNKTNFNTISEQLGDDETDNWKGKQITLTTALVSFKGKSTMSIRVVPGVATSGQPSRPITQKAAKVENQHEPAGICYKEDSDIPF